MDNGIQWDIVFFNILMVICLGEWFIHPETMHLQDRFDKKRWFLPREKQSEFVYSDQKCQELVCCF